MLKQTDKIKVLPNPWLLLNPDGLPQCAVMREVGNGIGWIGARFNPKLGTFSFEAEPVTATATRYVRTRISCGELILATPEAADDLGIAYIDPAKLLEKYKAAAVAQYDAQHGDGAWAKADALRNPPTKSDEPAKPARKTTASE
jgi:hypothetical protein